MNIRVKHNCTNEIEGQISLYRHTRKGQNSTKTQN